MTIKFKALNWKEVLADCLMNCSDEWFSTVDTLSTMVDDDEREAHMVSLEIPGYESIEVSALDILCKIDTEYAFLFIER